MFQKFAYNGTIEKCETSFIIKNGMKPSKAQIEVMEEDLRARFNGHLVKLVNLYIFAEKYEMDDVMNRTIDTIQDG